MSDFVDNPLLSLLRQAKERDSHFAAQVKQLNSRGLVGHHISELSLSNLYSGGSTRPPSLFSIPYFSFNMSVSRGAAPLTVLFQPLTNGYTGIFYWDFNGDGVLDASSHLTITHTYTQVGVYRPNSVLVSDAGFVWESANKPELTVLEGITTPVGEGDSDSLFIDDNDDYSTASVLYPGQMVRGRILSRGYAFFYLRGGYPGRYLVGTAPLKPVEDNKGSGVELTVTNEYGNVVLFRSGGFESFGFADVSLGYAGHWARLYGLPGTEYAFGFLPIKG